MREDLAKIVTESVGGGKDFHRKSGRASSMLRGVARRANSMLASGGLDAWDDTADLDDFLPPCEGMQAVRRRGRFLKEGHYRTGVLERAIAARTGRPWDQVYSEIRKAIPGRNRREVDAIDSLRWLVELNISIGQDGVPRTSGRGYDLLDNELYVDPSDRILKRWRRSKSGRQLREERRSDEARQERDRRLVLLEGDQGVELHRIGGLWFEIRFAPLPRPVEVKRAYLVNGELVQATELVGEPRHDVLTGGTLRYGDKVSLDGCRSGYSIVAHERCRKATRCATSKKQVNRKALEAHGLLNDHSSLIEPRRRGRRFLRVR